MKKILLVHLTLDRGGGAEMMRFMLLRRIDRNKYKIKICCIGRKGVLGRQIEELGYEVEELNQNPDSLSILITYRLWRLFRKEKPDMVHSSLFKANFHSRLAALLCGVPYIIIEEHGEHREYKTLKFLPYLFLDFIFAGLTTFIICCSENLRKDIIKKEKLPRKKVISIENCLDKDLYKVNISREEIQKRYNISDEIVFIVVASLKSGKGHDCLLKAFKEVKDTGHRFICFFAGGGALSKALQQRCREFGLSKEIIFLGKINNVADYLNASDVFILPSDSEGNSVALMEAMLMGLACIATAVGTNPDLIKTGFNGTIISPKDRQGLKKAIIFYIQNRDSIAVFGNRSKNIIETSHCFIEQYAREYYELWDKCGIAKK